jgi:hypothetical protein
MRSTTLRISTSCFRFCSRVSELRRRRLLSLRRRVARLQAPAAGQLAQTPGAQLITLDQAIQMAIEHNHNLLAARTTIQQNEAEEITANLRPNPVLLGDVQFLPFFQPSNFSAITWTIRRSSTWA